MGHSMFRDGPLTRRPPEQIRYTTGKCALGPLLVACSDKGVVTIMIRAKRAHLVADIHARFPKAELIHDPKGCAAVLATAIRYIAAPVGRFPARLDLRGTELQVRVWEAVRRIPFGKTSTYTRIAESIGRPRAIRAVASSCSRSWFAFAIPCHRVLHTGAVDEARRSGKAGVQYRWAAYEAGLVARRTASRPGRPAPEVLP
jgi:AraC family transcriptional regulator of adaptative response/methylated-DNA-[protein]-cysteine methyltransferase